MSIEIPEMVLLPGDRLIVAPWNPNEMSPRKFASLMEHMRESGFLQPLLVWPLTSPESRAEYVEDDDGGPYWLIIDGAHRYDAGTQSGMTDFPCIERPGFDEDMVKFRNMRMNMLRGRVDPAKFTTLYADLKERYPEKVIQAQMGLVHRGEIERLIDETAANLPDEAAKALKKKAPSIKGADDLGRVVEELITAQGKDLDMSFVVFSHGGQTHLMVEMERETSAKVDEVVEHCRKTGVDINVVFKHLLRDVSDLPANESELDVQWG